jgi:integrase
MTQRRDELNSALTVRQQLHQVVAERGLKQSTRICYQRSLTQLGVDLDGPVTAVTQQDVEDRLWGIANPNTRRSAAAAARSVFGFQIKIGKSVPRRYTMPSEDELRMAAMLCRYEIRMLLMMYCGLRLSEACAVTRDSLAGDRLRIDRQHQTLRETGVRTVTRMASVKTTESDVVIPAWLAERVRGVTTMDTADAVREAAKRSFRKMGIGHMTCTALRHWSATTLLANGVPLISVSRHLRHSDVSTTIRVYIESDDAQAIHRVFG